MKNVLIINGHPDKSSFSYAIHEAYKKGAQASGSLIDEIKITDLSFNLSLDHGYNKRSVLEPDLIEAQEKLKKADHIAIIYPIWWGSYPALLKGFLDRTLLPGFAFKKKPESLWWDKYFTGKTAQIISTADQPAWYYKWFNKEPSTVAMKKLTFNFIGIKKVKSLTLGPVRNSKSATREKWLKRVEKLGKKA